MKRSTKITSIIVIFFLIIAGVIIARTMIGNHFKKKFSKRPPPGIIVKTVEQRKFQNIIETENYVRVFNINIFGSMKISLQLEPRPNSRSRIAYPSVLNKEGNEA